MKKRFIELVFKTISPLSLSNGENKFSDKDFIRNSENVPYIPGSTMAGVFLDLFKNTADIQTDIDKTIKYYFGYEKENFAESKIIFYDANLIDKNDYSISIRNGVELDDNKVSISKKKYDYEILDSGAIFKTYLEQNIDENDENVIDYLALNANKIRIGGNTTRGFGKIEIKSTKCIEFTFDNDIDKYQDFDMFDINWGLTTWELTTKINCKEQNFLNYNLELELVSPILIREYSTDINTSDGEDSVVPDFIQLMSNDKPVVPGSTWSGAFRHHMIKEGIVSKEEIDKLFGKEGTNFVKSSIMFSESIIDGAESNTYIRNKIDRFTGGAVENALFTEKSFYGGHTNLVISIKKIDNKEVLKALAIAIADLNEGFLSIGGETSIGHGLFKVVMVNGININKSEEIYENIIKIEKEKRLM